ncbi:hypothetical protein [Catalinimonas niigatensis]|uniref:hypothetical protein n=1 Tax=Catalinimonas niigatensis TaxID=1397264 RepID=UPI002664FA8A|nr:hypothetical protein [Catalinimonas niigatensis]WPP49576.1 hypothetical protein PZB72_23160 [Catalinimonas niigatensis]
MKKNMVMLSRLFEEADRYIKNGTEQQAIQKKMGLHGYNPKRFLEGDGLLTEAKNWQNQMINLYGDKQEIASHLKAQEQETYNTFLDHVATVKYVFRKEPAVLAKFNVKAVSRSVNVWVQQASFFYAKVEEYANVLAAQGLTPEVLAQTTAMIQAVADARNRRIMRKGEAEEATRMRNASVKALKDWMKDFRYIARIALKDSPQLMEALGIVVKAKV